MYLHIYLFFICEVAKMKMCCEVSAQPLAVLLLLMHCAAISISCRQQRSIVWRGCVPEILNDPPPISHSDPVDFSSSVSASLYVWDLGSQIVIVAIPSPLSLSWYDLFSLVLNNSFSHNFLVSSGQLVKLFWTLTGFWWLTWLLCCGTLTYIGMSEILSSRISHRKCRQMFPVATQRPYFYILIRQK